MPNDQEAKRCSKCFKVKNINEFHRRDKLGSLGFRTECKECKRIARQKTYQNNKEYYLLKNKEWVENNKERWLRYQEKWHKENKEHFLAKCKAWRENNSERVRETNRVKMAKKRLIPKYRISGSLSSNIRQSIKYNKRNRHWEKLVGFTIEQLMGHLEKLFKPGMTWENYGTHWHIDHKTPIAVFNFDKPEHIDFRLCWSLSNLQPLEAKKNMSKGAKIDAPFQPSLPLSISIRKEQK